MGSHAQHKQKIGRNSLCWCGSGLKYKKCHLGREKEKRPSIHEMDREFKRQRNHGVCLHPEASPSTCSTKIAKAHTVQRTVLKKIAPNGHVYGIPLDFGAVVRASGIPVPTLMGIGKASTFTGFCVEHDSELFSPIETQEIRACEQHAYLLAFRSLCYELFAKQGGLLLGDHHRTLDRGLPIQLQITMQEELADIETGLKTALRDIQQLKAQFDEMFRLDSFSDIEYYVIWFEHPPDIMCSGNTYPKWDFTARQIQDISNLDVSCDQISLSLVASGNKGCAFFSWHKNCANTCRAFICSLINLPIEEIPHAIVRFVFSTFENRFMNPDWWEHLPEKTQEILVDRYRATVSLAIPYDPSYLCDDGIRAVSWKITKCETNVTNLRLLDTQ